MMNDLELVVERLKALKNDISSVISFSKYDEYDDLSGLDINYDDPNQLFLQSELRSILESLSDAKYEIGYLTKPVKCQGTLYKNRIGKYEIDEDHCFSCGAPIEAYIFDDFEERYMWVASVIEHNGKDYYLKGYKLVELAGLRVRVR